MNTESDIKLILFDIGFVLVKFTGASAIQQVSERFFTDKDYWKEWYEIDGVVDFECGRCCSVEFSTQVINNYKLKVSNDEFIEIFRNCAEKVYDGVYEYLNHLSSKYRLACLTNTNPIHWEKIKTEFDLCNYFEKSYVSYELGHMKPSPKIYQIMIEETNLKPQEILFIDDSEQHVLAAKKLGINSLLASGFIEAKFKINEFLEKCI